MRYLTNFSDFNLLESNQVVNPTKLESDAKKAGLDLKDEQTQKLIADEIGKQLIKGETPQLDFGKLARLASAQSVDATRIKEGKVYENAEEVIQITKKDITDTIAFVEKLDSKEKTFDQEIEGVKESIQKDVDFTPEEKTQKISNLEAFKKFAKEKWGEYISDITDIFTDIKTGLLKILNFINKILDSISTALGGVVAWISRKVFGLTNVQTRRVSSFVMPPLMFIITTVLFVVFWQILVGLFALSFASIISCILSYSWSALVGTGGFGSIVNILRGCGIFLSSIFKYKRETKILDSDTERAGDEAMFLGFLDRLETYLGRRFVIPPFARRVLEKTDAGNAATTTTGDPVRYQTASGVGETAKMAKYLAKHWSKYLNGFKRNTFAKGTKFPIKVDWKWFQQKIKYSFLFENLRLVNFLDNLFIKIVASGEKGFIDFKKLTGFPEGIPLISHIVNKEIHAGEPITKKVVEDFQEWLVKRWYRSIEIDTRGVPILFFLGLNPTKMTGSEIDIELAKFDKEVKNINQNKTIPKDQNQILASFSIGPQWTAIHPEPKDLPDPKTGKTFYQITGKTKFRKIDTEEEFLKNRAEWYNSIKDS